MVTHVWQLWVWRKSLVSKYVRITTLLWNTRCRLTIVLLQCKMKTSVDSTGIRWWTLQGSPQDPYGSQTWVYRVLGQTNLRRWIKLFRRSIPRGHYGRSNTCPWGRRVEMALIALKSSCLLKVWYKSVVRGGMGVGRGGCGCVWVLFLVTDSFV